MSILELKKLERSLAAFSSTTKRDTLVTVRLTAGEKDAWEGHARSLGWEEPTVLLRAVILDAVNGKVAAPKGDPRQLALNLAARSTESSPRGKRNSSPRSRTTSRAARKGARKRAGAKTRSKSRSGRKVSK